MELQGKRQKKHQRLKGTLKRFYTNIFVVSLLTQFLDFQNCNTLKWGFFFEIYLSNVKQRGSLGTFNTVPGSLKISWYLESKKCESAFV